MKCKEYKDKFVVLNKNHLDNLPEDIRENFRMSLAEVLLYIPENKYYVCNQDEPYSQQVIDLILSEGKQKINDSCNGTGEIKEATGTIKQLTIEELREQFEKETYQKSKPKMYNSYQYDNEYLQCRWEGYKLCAKANGILHS